MNQDPTKNSSRHNGDVTQVPQWGPKILGATAQNLVGRVALPPGFVHP